MREIPWNNQQNLEEKMPLWKIFLTCFKGPKQFVILEKQSSSRTVCYFFFLALIGTLFSTAVPMIGSLVGVGGISNYIKEKIPDFTLENGVFSIDAPMTYEQNGIQFYADSDVDEYTKEDVDTSLVSQILISKKNVILYNNGIARTIPFSDYKNITISKNTLLNQVPLFYLGAAFLVVFSYLQALTSLLFFMFLLAVFGLLTRQVNQYEFSFKKMFSLALYANTMQVSVQALNTSIGIMSVTVANVIGVIWTAYVFFAALLYLSIRKRGFGSKED